MKKFDSKIIDEFSNEGTVLFERMTGSRLYGTSYEKGEHPFDPEYVSDWDFRGVFKIDPKTKLMLPPFSRFSEMIKLDAFDSEMYEVEKFFKEASKNNPNYMDLIFGDEKSLIGSTEKGDELIKHRDLFLNEKIIDSFIGFARSQLTRIKNHNKWHTRYPYIYDVQNTLQTAFNNKDIDFNSIATIFSGQLARFITKESPNDKKQVANISLNEMFIKYFINKEYDVWDYAKPYVLNFLSVLTNEGFKVEKTVEVSDFLKHKASFKKKNESLYFIFDNGSGIFSEDGAIYPNPPITPNTKEPIKYILTVDYSSFKSKQEDIKSLWSWKLERNPKRAALEERFGYDVKHGMHTYRLLDSAILVCETGSYTPRLSGERLENAKDILSGKWDYEFLLSNAEEKIKILQNYKKQKVLKPKSDIKKLSELYSYIIYD